MSRRTVAAMVLALATACSPAPSTPSERPTASAPTSSDRPPGRETIRSTPVPLPDDVAGARFPWWSADGTSILFSATPRGSTRVQVLSVAPDGTALHCLTCGVASEVHLPLLKPMAFPDGKRVALRVGDQSPLRAADHAILECSPNVVDCRRAELVPVVPPDADDPAVVQDQRELRIAPDGEHVGITQVRRNAAGGQDLVAVVARLRRTSSSYELTDPRVVSSSGELKSFTPDGTRVLVAEFTPGPYDEANPDVVSIDLATGDQHRITYALDYDEPVELSPDGRLGQRIPAPGGLDGRPIWNWRPDGTALAYWEAAGSGFETDPVDSRLVVAELVDRQPTEQATAVRVPSPRWAPRLARFVPAGASDPSSRPGRVAGTVEVGVTGAADGKAVEVSYRGFADHAGWVIDGTERAERHGDHTTYTADLHLSGAHEGFLRADAVISAGRLVGTITSSVDGRRLQLPRPGSAGG